jgi:Kef-type K+ transport system membrane component KefB
MIDFPKNILLGTYIVEIYLINNGTILSYQSIPIFVNQVGMSAKISEFAYNQAVLYGLLAVFIAIFVGYLTNYFFVKFIKK